MDREKVINTFEKIINVCKEDGCDFVDLSFEDAEQILVMLKEQKAVKPITEDYMYKCGDCKWSFFSMNPTNILSMMQSVKFCPHCGKPIDWKGP